MLDMDGGTYYAQIRGFMTDQYCEKSAVVTWLLPTKASPPPEEKFDPATYIIGKGTYTLNTQRLSLTATKYVSSNINMNSQSYILLEF